MGDREWGKGVLEGGRGELNGCCFPKGGGERRVDGFRGTLFGRGGRCLVFFFLKSRDCWYEIRDFEIPPPETKICFFFFFRIGREGREGRWGIS